ncbi:MAG: LPS export ABC transporter periplasmic protein LptC [Vicinamibacteraceae bacterium]
MRWQRILRPLLGLFALAFAIWVGVSIRGRKPLPPSATPIRTDPEAVVESTKGSSYTHKGAAQDVRIDYDKLFTYQSGRSRFLGARITVLGRAGRDFDIRANEAEIAENQSQIDLRGAVVITTSDGLKIETENATYTESDGVTRAPGPVRFNRARMAGTSVGASYDRQRDVLWMLDQAHITVAADDKGAGAADVTSGAAGYAKRDRYIRFERNVRMKRGSQILSAEGAVVTLEAAADVVEQIELRGSAQVAGVGQGANGLEAMRSRDMNLGMADDGQTLQQATLIGEAVLRVAGGPGAPAQQLASQAIDVEIAPDGQSVQGLSAQDDVQLDLPAASAAAPTRRIRSRSLDADGEPGVPGLRTARFKGDVEFRESAPATKEKPAVERIVRAPALETKLQSGLGTIDRATFTEGVSVQDGTRTAKGPTMIYDVAQGTIALSSPAGVTGFVQVSDERINIEAGSLEWTLDGTRMLAKTNVKSVLKPGGGAAAGGKVVKRPSMLTADQAINVTAADMTYNQQTGHAEYSGDAQLWQGATSIRAKTITLDEATGNLTAKDTVRSVMRVEAKSSSKAEGATTKAEPVPAKPSPAAATPAPPATATATAAAPPVAAGAAAGPPRAAGPVRAAGAGVAPAAPTPSTPGAAQASAAPGGKSKSAVVASDTIATANELVYDDAERRARYTGTARMVGDQGDLRGERLELYFDESGRGLSRLEGFDNVRFDLKARPGGSRRWGNGVRITYFADDERYVLSGPRATVVERMEAQQCRETTGRTLTFFTSTDSVVVDSDNNSRTLTQTGTTCQEPTP